MAQNIVKKSSGICLMLLWMVPMQAAAVTEVMPETRTRIIVREHVKTGEPYVSIVSSDTENSENPLGPPQKRFLRPDYRMLDPDIKSGEIPYDGPVSDSTKVYIFAASIATVGVVGGIAASAAIPAAAAGTGAAAGGAGAFAGAGTAVAVGSISAAFLSSRPNPNRDDFIHTSASRLIET